MNTGVVATSFVIALTASSAAGAQTLPAAPRVRFTAVRGAGAESCPDETALAADISARLGRDPFDPHSELSVDLLIEHPAATWVARIFVRESPTGPAGARAMTSDAHDCGALASAIALAVALAIDPDARLNPPGRTPLIASPRSPPAMLPTATPTRGIAAASAEVVSVPPAPADSTPPARRAVATSPRSWDASDRVAVRGTWLIGPLPTPAGALGLVFDTTRTGHFRASLGASLTQESRLEAGGRVFGFALSSLFASVCAGIDRGRVAVAGCAGGQFGLVYAFIQTSALEPIPPAFHGWLAMTIAARASLHLVGPLVLDAGVEFAGALVRQRFQIETQGETITVFEQPFGALALHLAVGGTFR